MRDYLKRAAAAPVDLAIPTRPVVRPRTMDLELSPGDEESLGQCGYGGAQVCFSYGSQETGLCLKLFLPFFY
jgi:hypothetical protein